jgi:hypothetical protein
VGCVRRHGLERDRLHQSVEHRAFDFAARLVVHLLVGILRVLPDPATHVAAVQRSRKLPEVVHGGIELRQPCVLFGDLLRVEHDLLRVRFTRDPELGLQLRFPHADHGVGWNRGGVRRRLARAGGQAAQHDQYVNENRALRAHLFHRPS